LRRDVVTALTHHLSQLNGRRQPEMQKLQLPKFSPELVTLMRSALNMAVDRIDHSHRTPGTKAKMAQRIVRTVSEGITDLDALKSAAADEGREPAA
jgi:hypothetical protein